MEDSMPMKGARTSQTFGTEGRRPSELRAKEQEILNQLWRKPVL